LTSSTKLTRTRKFGDGSENVPLEDRGNPRRVHRAVPLVQVHEDRLILMGKSRLV
jgi:hypothetical protein